MVKTFTTEEQCILQGNPDIESVRGTRISFTDEFRDLAKNSLKIRRLIVRYFNISVLTQIFWERIELINFSGSYREK